MMPEKYQRLLEVSRPKLMRSIDLEDGLLCAHLRGRGVITSDQEGAIKEEPGGSSRKVGKLLDILLKGDCYTLEHFKDSLEASSPAHKTLAEECFGADTSTGKMSSHLPTFTAHKSHFRDLESERPPKQAKYEETEIPEPLPTSAPMVHLRDPEEESPPEQANYEDTEMPGPSIVSGSMKDQFEWWKGNSKEHFEWWKGHLEKEELTEEEEHRLKQIKSSLEDQKLAEDKGWPFYGKCVIGLTDLNIEVLRRRRNTLIQLMDTAVIDELQYSGALTKGDVRKIRRQRNRHQLNERLLDCLLTKDYTTYEKFKSALKAVGQSDLAEMLKREEQRIVEELTSLFTYSLWCAVIKSKRPALIKRMDTAVIDELQDSGALTRKDVRKIRRQSDRRLQIGNLLDCLVTKDYTTFGKLKSSLTKIGQDDLAELLNREGQRVLEELKNKNNKTSETKQS